MTRTLSQPIRLSGRLRWPLPSDWDGHAVIELGRYRAARACRRRGLPVRLARCRRRSARDGRCAAPDRDALTPAPRLEDRQGYVLRRVDPGSERAGGDTLESQATHSPIRGIGGQPLARLGTAADFLLDGFGWQWEGRLRFYPRT